MKFSCGKTRSRLNRIGLGAIWVMVSAGFGGALAQPPDVGMITQISGGVTYRSEEGQKKPEKAQAFMKILQGDHFLLEEKALLQLVYFRNGRKETWKGPAAFTAGEVKSQLKSDKGFQAQPAVQILPTGVLEGVRRVPVLLRRAGLSRSGTMQVRGMDKDSQKSAFPGKAEQVEIRKAEENYQRMRSQTETDDITPEMVLLGILADYDKYEEMETVIKKAQKISPGNEILKKLNEWVQAQKTAHPGKK
jgi:hypothetical protein